MVSPGVLSTHRHQATIEEIERALDAERPAPDILLRIREALACDLCALVLDGERDDWELRLATRVQQQALEALPEGPERAAGELALGLLAAALRDDAAAVDVLDAWLGPDATLSTTEAAAAAQRIDDAPVSRAAAVLTGPHATYDGRLVAAALTVLAPWDAVGLVGEQVGVHLRAVPVHAVAAPSLEVVAAQAIAAPRPATGGVRWREWLDGIIGRLAGGVGFQPAPAAMADMQTAGWEVPLVLGRQTAPELRARLLQEDAAAPVVVVLDLVPPAIAGPAPAGAAVELILASDPPTGEEREIPGLVGWLHGGEVSVRLMIDAGPVDVTVAEPGRLLQEHERRALLRILARVRLAATPKDAG